MTHTSKQAKKIRVAMVGLGMWGARAHLPTFAGRDDVEVVAIVEPNLDLARAPAATFGVTRLETDAAHLFRDSDGVDAVVIATPDDTHRDLALAAAARYGRWNQQREDGVGSSQGGPRRKSSETSAYAKPVAISASAGCQCQR
jgi:threonine dehydrogenase-like Zn-dependent dehydrogenase